MKNDRTAIAIFLALVAAAVVYHFGWRTAAAQAQESHVISGQSYSYVSVPLDNVEYVDCTFNNVTFVYEGKGQVKLTRATINGTTQWDSHSPAIRAAMHLVAAFDNKRPLPALEPWRLE